MYYIQDTTLQKQPFLYKTINEIVSHLEGTVIRKFNLTRKQYMQNLIDLGHGYDDPNGITFTQSLTDYFSIGIVRNDNLIKTNIHEAAAYSHYKTEMGD